MKSKKGFSVVGHCPIHGDILAPDVDDAHVSVDETGRVLAYDWEVLPFDFYPTRDEDDVGSGSN